MLLAYLKCNPLVRETLTDSGHRNLTYAAMNGGR